MLKSLEAQLGVITPAAKAAGIDVSTHRNWVKNDPAYAEAVDDLAFVQLDFVHSKLLEGVNQGNPALIMYYLSSKGASLGYHHQRSAHWAKQAAAANGEDDRDLNITIAYE